MGAPQAPQGGLSPLWNPLAPAPGVSPDGAPPSHKPRTVRRFEKVSARLPLRPWVVLESLGYRQLTIIWRLPGLIKFVLGRKDRGKMERRALETSEPA